MNVRFPAILALVLALPVGAQAATPPEGPFGLGIGGGFGVSGLSGKLYMGDATAFQGIVGLYGLGSDHDNDGLGVGLDYLLERPAFVSVAPLELGWNFGLGGTVALWDDSHDDNLRVGASGVLGLEILFQPVPIDLVLEYRPGVVIIPDFDIDLVNFSGHLRYYF
ncbi:MAG: hypothetical protein JXB39_16250 [Deltaproteobacteria bacterium]|nr:hypothetical protein [Deltaproteobacteria bacterium]